MNDSSKSKNEETVSFARVSEKAEEIFGSQEKAEQWLNLPNALLNGSSPAQVIKNSFESEKVMDILSRIEYGVFS